MTIDRYTKTVLTIIAACLVWISMGGPALLTGVAAQDAAQDVIIAGWKDGSLRRLPNPASPVAAIPAR